MRTLIAAAVVALLGSGTAGAGGPNTLTLLALEPPAVFLAGGYDIQLDVSPSDRGKLFDQALALHLTDPNRGAPLGRAALRPPRVPGPDHFAVHGGEGATGILAAAPAGTNRQQMVLRTTLEDPEYWEAWDIQQTAGGEWRFCLGREATLRARVDVVDGADGRVLSQERVEWVEPSRECGTSREEAQQRALSEESLADFATDSLAREVANRVAPRWEEVEVRLVRKGASGRGHKLMRSGDLVAATRWYVAAAAKAGDDPWLHYHAAVLLTAGFHFGQAREHLAKARAVEDAPLFAEWEESLHERERAALMLRRMGVPQEPLRY